MLSVLCVKLGEIYNFYFNIIIFVRSINEPQR